MIPNIELMEDILVTSGAVLQMLEGYFVMVHLPNKNVAQPSKIIVNEP